MDLFISLATHVVLPLRLFFLPGFLSLLMPFLLLDGFCGHFFVLMPGVGYIGQMGTKVFLVAGLCCGSVNAVGACLMLVIQLHCTNMKLCRLVTGILAFAVA